MTEKTLHFPVVRLPSMVARLPAPSNDCHTLPLLTTLGSAVSRLAIFCLLQPVPGIPFDPMYGTTQLQKVYWSLQCKMFAHPAGKQFKIFALRRVICATCIQGWMLQYETVIVICFLSTRDGRSFNLAIYLFITSIACWNVRNTGQAPLTKPSIFPL